ncbi:unnamed protein product, partial [Schistosoma turkestanicum]
ILTLRSLYEQLFYFTTPNEHNQFKMDSGLYTLMFKTLQFNNIKQDTTSPIIKLFTDPLAYSPYTVEQWQSAIHLIDARLRPIEECAATRFLIRIRSLSNKVD